MQKNIYLPEGYSEFEKSQAVFSLSMLEEAKENGTILEALAVKCSQTLDLSVDLGNICGIIPKSEIAYQKDGAPKDIAAISRVGKK